MCNDTRFDDWLQRAIQRGERLLQRTPRTTTRPRGRYRLLRAVPKWYEPRPQMYPPEQIHFRARPLARPTRNSMHYKK